MDDLKKRVFLLNKEDWTKSVNRFTFNVEQIERKYCKRSTGLAFDLRKNEVVFEAANCTYTDDTKLISALKNRKMPELVEGTSLLSAPFVDNDKSVVRLKKLNKMFQMSGVEGNSDDILKTKENEPKNLKGSMIQNGNLPASVEEDDEYFSTINSELDLHGFDNFSENGIGHHMSLSPSSDSDDSDDTYIVRNYRKIEPVDHKNDKVLLEESQNMSSALLVPKNEHTPDLRHNVQSDEEEEIDVGDANLSSPQVNITEELYAPAYVTRRFLSKLDGTVVRIPKSESRNDVNEMDKKNSVKQKKSNAKKTTMNEKRAKKNSPIVKKKAKLVSTSTVTINSPSETTTASIRESLFLRKYKNPADMWKHMETIIRQKSAIQTATCRSDTFTSPKTNSFLFRAASHTPVDSVPINVLTAVPCDSFKQTLSSNRAYRSTSPEKRGREMFRKSHLSTNISPIAIRPSEGLFKNTPKNLQKNVKEDSPLARQKKVKASSLQKTKTSQVKSPSVKRTSSGGGKRGRPRKLIAKEDKPIFYTNPKDLTTTEAKFFLESYCLSELLVGRDLITITSVEDLCSKVPNATKFFAEVSEVETVVNVVLEWVVDWLRENKPISRGFRHFSTLTELCWITNVAIPQLCAFALSKLRHCTIENAYKLCFEQ